MKNTGFEIPSFENILKIRGPSKTQLFFNKSGTVAISLKSAVAGAGKVSILSQTSRDIAELATLESPPEVSLNIFFKSGKFIFTLFLGSFS